MWGLLGFLAIVYSILIATGAVFIEPDKKLITQLFTLLIGLVLYLKQDISDINKRLDEESIQNAEARRKHNN